MKIDLAVYTAIHGYDWQPGTVYSTSDLVRYKRGIGRLPDPLMEELPFGGVFNDGDTIVFYRYHMAIKSDAKGRDSLYLVLGTLQKSEVGKVDFKYLFALSEFAKPLKPTPVQTTYIGSAATGSPPDFSASFRRSVRGGAALSEIGTWFSLIPVGVLSIRISGSSEDPVLSVQYDKPRMEETKPEHTYRPEMSRQHGIPNQQVNSPNYNFASYPMSPNSNPAPAPSMQSLLLQILLALLVGGIVGWYARDVKDWISDKVKAIQESKQPTSNPSSGLSVKPGWAEPSKFLPDKDDRNITDPGNMPPVFPPEEMEIRKSSMGHGWPDRRCSYNPQ